LYPKAWQSSHPPHAAYSRPDVDMAHNQCAQPIRARALAASLVFVLVAIFAALAATVLLSTLGGIEIFGMNGVILGPLIAAMFLVVWGYALRVKARGAKRYATSEP
jgi:high-affinity Fe2+/Pb2+ permease